MNRDYNFVQLRDWQSTLTLTLTLTLTQKLGRGLLGKVDEDVGLMLGIIVSLWYGSLSLESSRVECVP